jgi:hypothetical protein
MNDVLKMFSYTLTQVIEAWPNSRIVVIAPWFLSEPVLRPGAFRGRTIGAELLSVLDSSSRFARVDLIDPAELHWFAGVDVKTLTDDGIHPNSRGDEAIATLLTDALTAEGATSPS